MSRPPTAKVPLRSERLKQANVQTFALQLVIGDQDLLSSLPSDSLREVFSWLGHLDLDAITTANQTLHPFAVSARPHVTVGAAEELTISRTKSKEYTLKITYSPQCFSPVKLFAVTDEMFRGLLAGAFANVFIPILNSVFERICAIPIKFVFNTVTFEGVCFDEIFFKCCKQRFAVRFRKIVLSNAVFSIAPPAVNAGNVNPGFVPVALQIPAAAAPIPTQPLDDFHGWLLGSLPQEIVLSSAHLSDFKPEELLTCIVRTYLGIVDNPTVRIESTRAIKEIRTPSIDDSDILNDIERTASYLLLSELAYFPNLHLDYLVFSIDDIADAILERYNMQRAGQWCVLTERRVDLAALDKNLPAGMIVEAKPRGKYEFRHNDDLVITALSSKEPSSKEHGRLTVQFH